MIQENTGHRWIVKYNYTFQFIIICLARLNIAINTISINFL